MICTVAGCNNEQVTRIGYCTIHFKEHKKAINLKASRRRRQTPEHKEYMEKTREARLIKYKAYREEHSEHLKELDRENYYKNQERNLANKKVYRELHKEKINENLVVWRHKNPDKVKALNQKYYTENYGKVLNGIYRREFRVRKANIDPALNFEIEQIFDNCQENQVVDHIVPLQGKEVCGLHVPWNLQYLSPEENNYKRHRFDGTYDNTSWIELFNKNKKLKI